MTPSIPTQSRTQPRKMVSEMGIANLHPIVAKLDASDLDLHLIGSRYVGKFDRDRSDWDFLLVVHGDYTERKEMETRLTDFGFVRQGHLGYGPDPRIIGTNVWTCKTEGWPDVDILPVRQEEAELRLRFFRAMKSRGDSSGLIALGLKSAKAWPELWGVLEKLLSSDKSGD